MNCQWYYPHHNPKMLMNSLKVIVTIITLGGFYLNVVCVLCHCCRYIATCMFIYVPLSLLCNQRNNNLHLLLHVAKRLTMCSQIQSFQAYQLLSLAYCIIMIIPGTCLHLPGSYSLLQQKSVMQSVVIMIKGYSSVHRAANFSIMADIMMSS